jgi:hypothetical protein
MGGRWLALVGASLVAGASAEQQVLRADAAVSYSALVPGWGVPAAVPGCCAAPTNSAGGCSALGLTKAVGLGSLVACCAGKPASINCASVNDFWSGSLIYAGTTYQCATLATGQPKCPEPSATTSAEVTLPPAVTLPPVATLSPATSPIGSNFLAPAGGCTVPSGTACPTNAAFPSVSSSSAGGIKYCCYGGSMMFSCGSIFNGQPSGSFSCGSQSAACSDVPACSGSSTSVAPSAPSGAAWLAPSVLAALGVVVAALA